MENMLQDLKILKNNFMLDLGGSMKDLDYPHSSALLTPISPSDDPPEAEPPSKRPKMQKRSCALHRSISRSCDLRSHADPLAAHEASMEINDHYTQLARKDLGQAGVFVGPREQGGGPGGGGGGPGGMPPEDLRAQLLTLKQQQHIQQQMLLQKFHEQQVRLAAEHEKQIQEHVKVLMAQKQQQEMFEAQQLHEQQAMEKERQEKERLQLIKNKNKNEQSAVASSAVKMKLQEFVLNKKHRESHGGSLSNSPPQFRHWSAQHRSLDQHSPPQSGLSPPYRPHPVLGQYEKDFPLRKTVSDSNLKVRSKLKEKVAQRSSPLLRRKDLAGAKRKTPLSTSEPNLKVRLALKQKMIEKRGSPLLRRKDKLFKRNPVSIDTGACHSNPDSGPNTPPSGSLQNHSDQHTPPREENGRPFPLQMMSKMVINHSMPNISIGNPRDSPGCQDPSRTNKSSSGLTEAELHARGAIPHGVPLTSHMMHGSLQFYPSLPVIDSEMTPPTSPAYITAQMKTLEQGSTSKLVSSTGGGVPGIHHGVPYAVPNNGSPITDAQAAHARLHRRPLSRTHSAPLPLGPPLLPQSGLLLHQQEQLIKENQKLYLKQRLQSTVLNRSNNSKNHMENMDEEGENRLGQDSEEDVVIIDEQSPPSPPRRPPHFHSRSFNQQRELVRQHAVQSESPPAPGVRPPLERAQSSPVVMAPPLSPPQNVPQDITMKCIDATGIAYDPVMLKHGCACGNNSGHPEHAGRLQSIWARLHETGLVKRCERVKARKATIDELQLVHDEVYALVYGTNSLNRPKLAPHIIETLPSRFCLLPCGGVGVDSDTVWHDIHTSQAARMATGCVIELAYRVAVGDLKNGFAIVRPPGHHAEANQAMGFCFFNSVAIAVRVLQQKLNMKRILIFDWDVHHGNSTQQAFYNDPGVLYLSMHRHDNGNFFPGTGAPEEVGVDKGTGFTVNVAFSGCLSPPMGDAEYIAAFRTIVMPIAREYNPEIVIVSAGFDAAAGHPAPLGGYKVSSEMFGFMTKELMTISQGKLVLVLEGGYDLPSICDSAEICIQALLGDEISMLKDDQLRIPPSECAVEDLKRVMEVQANHWPCVTKFANSVKLSLYEAQRDHDEADTLSAFASLSVVQENSPAQTDHQLSNDEPVNVTEIVPVEEDDEEAERMEES